MKSTFTKLVFLLISAFFTLNAFAQESSSAVKSEVQRLRDTVNSPAKKQTVPRWANFSFDSLDAEYFLTGRDAELPEEEGYFCSGVGDSLIVALRDAIISVYGFISYNVKAYSTSEEQMTEEHISTPDLSEYMKVIDTYHDQINDRWYALIFLSYDDITNGLKNADKYPQVRVITVDNGESVSQEIYWKF